MAENYSNINGERVISDRDGCDNIVSVFACAYISILANDLVFFAENAETVFKLVDCLKKGPKDCTSWPLIVKLLYSRLKNTERINKIYKWCCKQTETFEKCGPPVSYTIEDVDWNTYRISVHGPGNYTTTVWGGGSNVVYLQNPTPMPSTIVSIPNPNLPSVISGKLICIDKSGMHEISFSFAPRQIANTTHNLPNPYWIAAPPSNVTVSSTHDIQIGNAPSTGDDYSITISSPGLTIVSQGNGPGNYRMFAPSPGTFTITVTFRHNCTGETTTLTKAITVT